MEITTNVSKKFSSFFTSENLKPFAEKVFSKLMEGNICVEINKSADIEILRKEKLVSFDPKNSQPFIVRNNKLYLHKYYNYEDLIFKKIVSFIETEKMWESGRKMFLKKNAEYVKELFPGKNDKWQLIAALISVLKNFTIITGGPGTGKTTTVSKILKLLQLENPKLRVAIVAPTGKAASRMAETLNNNGKNNFQPSTIHRFLEKYKRQDPKFKLPIDLIIADESSMIDAALFAKLIAVIPETARLILLGDKDQLASVEAGSLFGDLCRTVEKINTFSQETIDFFKMFSEENFDENVSTVKHILNDHLVGLVYSHRFSKEKGIGLFSEAVIQNDENALKEFSDDDVVIDNSYSEKVFNDFIEGYRSFIEEPDINKALDKFSNCMVLCAVRNGYHGVYSLNNKIENYLLKEGLIDIQGKYYHNCPIIITSNLYNLGLFNGDIGIIRKDGNGNLKAWFKNKENGVVPAFIHSAETVFAMTIHKSQGSEFNKILVVLPEKNSPLLTRELLYTAVTRAKQKVIIQATQEIIMQTASQKVERGSGLIERFKEINS